MENQQKEDIQELCKAGCGFFGAKHQQGYCSIFKSTKVLIPEIVISVCFKEKQSRDTNSAPAPASTVVPSEEKKPEMPSPSSNGRKRKHEETNKSSEQEATRLPSTDSESQKKVTDSMADMNVNPSTSLPIPSASPVKVEDEASTPESSSAEPKSPSVVAEDSPAAPPAKKAKKRCGVCKKKLGLTGFECRCGLLFCGVHRYSDKHDCSFDYKENGRAELAKANQACVAEKINKL
ncbi:Oidioi.mRNA.OKI2018_I69.PAR.g8950.t3.cds [Oikopleura dioica]|uniref:Oidioi.mRNA.OKI2018_I69.PAR.g8950.t3.cds n=1 Tax=Oikopleura dioica TaxID=34765 RepID=A0ABN7RIA9_OIKDI|nr:Oidioi.mRNA.OKI2018_I69.PAR.g8950.t3.cds [Oikopleura dioica]